MYIQQELDKFLVSCKSGKDSQEQEREPEQESAVYERENVEHGRNCSCCTSFSESAKLDELRRKQRRKHKGSAVVAIAAERDFFDPTTEYWDKEDGPE